MSQIKLMQTYNIPAHIFVLKIDEKSSHTDGLQYDLMIFDSGLLFSATVYAVSHCFIHHH